MDFIRVVSLSSYMCFSVLLISNLPFSLPTYYAHTYFYVGSAAGISSEASNASARPSHAPEASWWEYVTWLAQSTTSANNSLDATNYSLSLSAPSASVQSTPADEIGAFSEADAEDRPRDDEEVRSSKREVKISDDVIGQTSAHLQTITTTASSGNGSIWYLPWPWSSTAYSSSSSQPANYSGTSGISSVEETAEAIKARQEKEEQIEKLAAELRASDTATSTQNAPLTAEASPVENPVSAMIDKSKYGWASFFTSRSLMMKRLGYDVDSNRRIEDVKRDENGMEIMDLDFDEEDPDLDGASSSRGRGTETKRVPGPGSIASPPTGSTPARVLSPVSIKKSTTSNYAASSHSDSGANSVSSSLKNRLAVIPPPLMVSADVKHESANLGHSGNGGSAASTPRGGNTGANTPVPPSPSTSTSSKSAARPPSSVGALNGNTNDIGSSIVPPVATTKRTASPAPSVKSGKTLVSPPPPNLVLPTWQDTFHTPPRNVLPPKPEVYVDDQGVGGKLLGKTMKFMSNVLFSKDGGSSSSPLAPFVGGAGATRAKGKERERISARDGSAARARLYNDQEASSAPGESLIERERHERFKNWGKELPKAWHVFEEAGYDTSNMGHGHSGDPFPPPMQRRTVSSASTETSPKHVHGVTADAEAEMKGMKDVLRGCTRVVVIGVHGWFPGSC
jgi:hypothetical protein